MNHQPRDKKQSKPSTRTLAPSQQQSLKLHEICTSGQAYDRTLNIIKTLTPASESKVIKHVKPTSFLTELTSLKTVLVGLVRPSLPPHISRISARSSQSSIRKSQPTNLKQMTWWSAGSQDSHNQCMQQQQQLDTEAPYDTALPPS